MMCRQPHEKFNASNSKESTTEPYLAETQTRIANFAGTYFEREFIGANPGYLGVGAFQQGGKPMGNLHPLESPFGLIL
jgi:hypothetical protein